MNDYLVVLVLFSLEGSAIKGIDSMDSSFDLSSSISDELEV